MFRNELDHITQILAKILESISNNQGEMEGIQGQAMPSTDQPWGRDIGGSKMNMITMEER